MAWSYRQEAYVVLTLMPAYRVRRVYLRGGRTDSNCRLTSRERCWADRYACDCAVKTDAYSQLMLQCCQLTMPRTLRWWLISICLFFFFKQKTAYEMIW